MMKNRVYRLFAALLAMMVLAAPVGALAEEAAEAPQSLNLTAGLSDMKIKMGSISINMDADYTIDATISEDGSIMAVNTIDTDDGEQIKTACLFDPASMNVLLSVNDVNTAALIPVGQLISEAVEEAAEEYGLETEDDEDVAASQNAQALNDAVNAVAAALQTVDTQAIADIGNAFLNEHVVYVGELEENEDEFALYGTFQQYTFSFTMKDVLEMDNAAIDALKGNEELVSAVQNLIDVIADMTGEESEISVADLTLPETDSEASFSGVLEISENGDFLMQIRYVEDDPEEGETVLVSLYSGTPGEAEKKVGASVDMGGAVILSANAAFRTDGVPVFAFDSRMYEDFGGFMTIEQTLTANADLTEKIDISGTMVTTYEYKLSDGTETHTGTTNLRIDADYINNDEMLGFSGTVTEEIADEEATVVLTCDVFGGLTAESTVDYDMPASYIDITDDEAEGRDELIEALRGSITKTITLLTGLNMGEIETIIDDIDIMDTL